MNLRLNRLLVRARKSVETIDLSSNVTFIYGPISKGKSTVVRMIDYCLGGDLERTPAVQKEFISAELILVLAASNCVIERSADDNQSVRVSWTDEKGTPTSLIVPFLAAEVPLITGEAVFNLSDLLFFLSGTQPIKVRKNRSDPDSDMIRLSFRDIWWYCYLEQTHLDSSFFRLEDTFRGRKSQDALRFFTGLHSEGLSQIESELMRTQDIQRTKRESVLQIRRFMSQFELGTELEISGQIRKLDADLLLQRGIKVDLESGRFARTHPTDALRERLRNLGAHIEVLTKSLFDSESTLDDQRALQSELINAKTKQDRLHRATLFIKANPIVHCPECGTDISTREPDQHHCRLCGSEQVGESDDPLDQEVQRRDINDRIDQIADAIRRRESETLRLKRSIEALVNEKSAMDEQLGQELQRYDSSFVEQIRSVDREIATLEEKKRSLARLQRMPEAINALETEADSLQSRITALKFAFDEERDRLRNADTVIKKIADEFKRTLMAVEFPGVDPSDRVVIDPRNWRPYVIHEDTEWSFWDAGSGGKKTLFNVCYALTIHSVAVELGLPVPKVLIIDSPTKNISDDMNPEIVAALYKEIYRLGYSEDKNGVQILLIDSEIVQPLAKDYPSFKVRRMAGEPDAPSLFSTYIGP